MSQKQLRGVPHASKANASEVDVSQVLAVMLHPVVVKTGTRTGRRSKFVHPI